MKNKSQLVPVRKARLLLRVVRRGIGDRPVTEENVAFFRTNCPVEATRIIADLGGKVKLTRKGISNQAIREEDVVFPTDCPIEAAGTFIHKEGIVGTKKTREIQWPIIFDPQDVSCSPLFERSGNHRYRMKTSQIMIVLKTLEITFDDREEGISLTTDGFFLVKLLY